MEGLNCVEKEIIGSSQIENETQIGEISFLCLNQEETTKYLGLSNVEDSDGITSIYTQIGPNRRILDEQNTPE